VGGLVSMRRGEDYDNAVAAADSFYRLTERDSFRVQFAGSRTRYPNAIADAFKQEHGSFTGHGARLSYSHNDRDWSSGGTYVETSPGFRADSGFITQVGVRALSVFADRRIRGGADRWFRNLFVGGGADTTREFNGEWTEWGADLNLTYEGPRELSVELNASPNQEYFAGVTYHSFRYGVTTSMQLSRDVALGFSVRTGETIDFNNGQHANFVTAGAWSDINLGRRLRGELAWDYQVLDTKQGARVFDIHLPQARLLWHFSRRAYVRTILQYRMLSVVTPEMAEQRRLLTQLLFSYRVNAQTVFLAGYSDNYDGERDLTRTDRAVFVKVGYAWLW
jgi:hypothetical protein